MIRERRREGQKRRSKLGKRPEDARRDLSEGLAVSEEELPVLLKQVGDWKVCVDADGLYYHHIPTDSYYDDPPPELAQQLQVLPTDAPPGHKAHKMVCYSASNRRAAFEDIFDGVPIRIQTTLSGCAGSPDACARVARACYLKCEEGYSREEVLEFRSECYTKLQSVDSAVASPKVDSAVASKAGGVAMEVDSAVALEPSEPAKVESVDDEALAEAVPPDAPPGDIVHKKALLHSILKSWHLADTKAVLEQAEATAVLEQAKAEPSVPALQEAEALLLPKQESLQAALKMAGEAQRSGGGPQAKQEVVETLQSLQVQVNSKIKQVRDLHQIILVQKTCENFRCFTRHVVMQTEEATTALLGGPGVCKQNIQQAQAVVQKASDKLEAAITRIEAKRKTTSLPTAKEELRKLEEWARAQQQRLSTINVNIAVKAAAVFEDDVMLMELTTEESNAAAEETTKAEGKRWFGRYARKAKESQGKRRKGIRFPRLIHVRRGAFFDKAAAVYLVFQAALRIKG